MNNDLWDICVRHRVTVEDRAIAYRVIPPDRTPDLIIAPDGEPYLYRWHVIPRNPHGNVYFHIQVRSDPERPLHDHPWDNTSGILAGIYHELMDMTPSRGVPVWYARRRGHVIFREAHWAHRLTLPPDTPYTMTLFTTGPKIREWGYWTDRGWVHNEELNRISEDGLSTYHDRSKE